MTRAAERALENVRQEYMASAQSLNCRERIDVLNDLITWAVAERGSEADMLEEISWWGTSPMGGQD